MTDSATPPNQPIQADPPAIAWHALTAAEVAAGSTSIRPGA